MLKRQRLLLSLVDRAGGSASRAWLVRAAFLASHDRRGWASSPLYAFVPHRDGPHSFSLERELQTLERDGFVSAADGDAVSLAPSGRGECASIDPAHAFALRGAWHRFGLANPAALAARIDAEFPWFTMNAADPARRRVARPRASCALYTAGYRGTSIDGFLDALLARGIERIVDGRERSRRRRVATGRVPDARTGARLAGGESGTAPRAGRRVARAALDSAA